MDEHKKKIIVTIAEDEFVKYGIKKTSMEKIAKRLQISKKTIYKFFPNKKELLRAIVNNISKQLDSQINEIINSRKNAVRKFYLMGKLIGDRVRKISPEWLNDLKTVYPELWREIEVFRRERIQKNMTKLLEQGKKEGLIVRKPTVVILTVLLSSVEGVVNPEVIANNNLSVQSALEMTLEIIISGILTAKGRKIFLKSKKVTG